MSERQQLALIKQLEETMMQENIDCSPNLVSPPRTPLGPLNTTPSNSGRGERTPQEDRQLKKVSKRNHRGETPLHCSAIKGNVALVRKLLRMGADPNTQDNAGWSPLHEACNRGNLSVAKLLLRHGAQVNCNGMGKETPLHDAARNGHYQVVRLLLLNGADPDLLNGDGRTALSVASDFNNPCTNPELVSVVKLLKGELALGDPDHGVGGVGASKGLFRGPGQAGHQDSLSGQGKAAAGGGSKGSSKGKLSYGGPPSTQQGMSGEEVSSSQGGKEEDVYEFKTSSKEATPTSSRGSASPGNNGEGGSGDKRSKEEDPVEDADGDGRQRKKRKEEGSAGRGRGVRGNSTEKTVGGKAAGGRGRGGNTADRKSPPGGSREPPSPAPSPGKSKQPKQEGAGAGGVAGAGQGGDSESDGEKGKGEGGPKVPPLKIVLNSGNAGREEDKKKNYIVNNGSEDGESSEGKTEGAESSAGDTGEKGGRGERVTRSRGQQGGEEEEGPGEQQKEEQRSGMDNEYHIKKRKLRGGAGEEPTTSNGGIVRQSGEPLTDIEKHLNIRKQIEQRRKNLFPVQPKPPQGFKDYLMNKKTYHLEGNTGKDSRIQPIPKIAPPPSLEGPLRELFLSQENERYKLRMKHLVEKEKLVLAVEQEILRVHGRAARALANQSLPYSVCTILRDEEVYTPIDPHQEEKNRDIRSRYNGRLFLSWLQDVDDKWEKIKEQMVLRHHNEAESLNAVQKMDWEWKLSEINSGMKVKPATDDLHVPMVQVNEDFDQLVS